MPQMRLSCKSDSQTLAETLPSFLCWRKLRSTARHPSLPPASLSPRLLSPQALQYPGIKKRGLSLHPSPLPPPPPPPRLFPEAKQQHGAAFVEAGVESCTERQQILPTPSYHCNYAFHCPDTKDDRMCGIGPVFHSVSTLFLHLTVSEKRLAQQGNARLVPHLVDRGRGGANGAVVQTPAK